MPVIFPLVPAAEVQDEAAVSAHKKTGILGRMPADFLHVAMGPACCHGTCMLPWEQIYPERRVCSVHDMGF